MGDAFDEGAFALTEINSVSNIVRTEFGFHLIKLTDLNLNLDLYLCYITPVIL